MKAGKRKRRSHSLTAGRLAVKLPGRVPQRSQHVGFAWYEEAQWLRLREIADDPGALDDSYQAWLGSAEQAVATLRRQGISVEKIPLDVEHVAEWCKREQRPFNSAARAAFVIDFLRKRSGGS